MKLSRRPNTKGRRPTKRKPSRARSSEPSPPPRSPQTSPMPGSNEIARLAAPYAIKQQRARRDRDRERRAKPKPEIFQSSRRKSLSKIPWLIHGFSTRQGGVTKGVRWQPAKSRRHERRHARITRSTIASLAEGDRRRNARERRGPLMQMRPGSFADRPSRRQNKARIQLPATDYYGGSGTSYRSKSCRLSSCYRRRSCDARHRSLP